MSKYEEEISSLTDPIIKSAKEWSSKYKNSLPDDSYAWIDPKTGEGKLPFKNKKGKLDASHIRNALSRLNQTDGPSAEQKNKIKTKLEKALASVNRESNIKTSSFLESDDPAGRIKEILAGEDNHIEVGGLEPEDAGLNSEDYKNDDDLAEEMLSRGALEEREHKPTYDALVNYIKTTGKMMDEDEFYRSIAGDHNRKIPDYYVRLEKMEREAINEALEKSKTNKQEEEKNKVVVKSTKEPNVDSTEVKSQEKDKKNSSDGDKNSDQNVADKLGSKFESVLQNSPGEYLIVSISDIFAGLKDNKKG
jgi:hypothetical protein